MSRPEPDQCPRCGHQTFECNPWRQAASLDVGGQDYHFRHTCSECGHEQDFGQTGGILDSVIDPCPRCGGQVDTYEYVLGS